MHAAQVAISFTLIKHGGRAGQGLEQGEKNQSHQGTESGVP